MTDIKYKVQTSEGHYKFSSYMHLKRWNSIWHQMNEILKSTPTSTLEIGPGPGTLKSIASLFGHTITTLDIDPSLNPDILGSATAIPLKNNEVDTACAFQVLEHIPYEHALKAFKEMCRVARRTVIISLPEAKRSWSNRLYIPLLGDFHFFVRRPTYFPSEHRFDGEHYWEISKKGYPLRKIIRDLSEHANLTRQYIIPENTYHRLFVFSTEKKAEELKNNE